MMHVVVSSHHPKVPASKQPAGQLRCLLQRLRMRHVQIRVDEVTEDRRQCQRYAGSQYRRSPRLRRDPWQSRQQRDDESQSAQTVQTQPITGANNLFALRSKHRQLATNLFALLDAAELSNMILPERAQVVYDMVRVVNPSQIPQRKRTLLPALDSLSWRMANSLVQDRFGQTGNHVSNCQPGQERTGSFEHMHRWSVQLVLMRRMTTSRSPASIFSITASRQKRLIAAISNPTRCHDTAGRHARDEGAVCRQS